MDWQKVWRWVRAAALAVAPVVVAKVTQACPALFSPEGLFALAGGLAAAYLALRQGKGGKVAAAHTGVWSVLGSGWLLLRDQITALCGVDFLHQAPTIVATAVCVGLASYVHGGDVPAK